MAGTVDNEDATLALMRELTEAPAVPGQEERVREVMARHLTGVAELGRDALGSFIARKSGGGERPRVMVTAHMDEVGFLVTHIMDDGYLRFQTLGGWWEQVMLAQRVLVLGRGGEYVGVIGSKPPHVLSPEERKKMVEKKEMFIDVGASSKEEVERLGIRPGDPVVPICPLTPMTNDRFLLAKAWDNRAGCAVVVETLRRLAQKNHPNTVYGVATVQEEVGLRGATTATNAVAPDVGFAVDVGVAGDTPGMKPEDAAIKLGKGPGVVLYDASMVPHTRLRDLMIETAVSEGIPYQYEWMPGGGTDAGRIHIFGEGVPTLSVSIPARYIHSHASVIHRDDFENTVRLMLAMIQRLDERTVAALRS